MAIKQRAMNTRRSNQLVKFLITLLVVCCCLLLASLNYFHRHYYYHRHSLYSFSTHNDDMPFGILSNLPRNVAGNVIHDNPSFLLTEEATSNGTNRNQGNIHGQQPVHRNTSTDRNISIAGPDAWWELHAEALARPWMPWNENYPPFDWCIPQTRVLKRPKQVVGTESVGIMYTKNPKAASSTGAGITLQIAHNVAQRLNYSYTVCTSNWSHPFAHWKGFAYRNPSKSFLWTNIRHPKSKCISEYTHFIMSRQNSTKLDGLPRFCQDTKSSQIKYLHTSKKRINLRHIQAAKDSLTRYVLGSYDFIAIVERQEESLIVLKLLLGLEHSDILVLSAKQSNQHHWEQLGDSCQPVIKSNGTLSKQLLANSSTLGNYDYLLYAAVNRSLDLTIDSLGRERVHREVQIHRQLQRLANRHCQSKAYFPCSNNGTLQITQSQQSCFAEDVGCGHACVQQTSRLRQ